MPDAITRLFKEAYDTFPPLEGKPTDDDLLAIKECLLPLLMVIVYDQLKGIHSADRLLVSLSKMACFFLPSCDSQYASSMCSISLPKMHFKICLFGFIYPALSWTLILPLSEYPGVTKLHASLLGHLRIWYGTVPFPNGCGWDVFSINVQRASTIFPGPGICLDLCVFFKANAASDKENIWLRAECLNGGSKRPWRWRGGGANSAGGRGLVLPQQWVQFLAQSARRLRSSEFYCGRAMAYVTVNCSRKIALSGVVWRCCRSQREEKTPTGGVKSNFNLCRMSYIDRCR